MKSDKLERLKKFLNRWEWLILIVGLVVLFRIPSLFEPHHYGDEEIYFVMGRAWREGVPLYAGAFDHKPPLIYIMAGIAESVFWFRLILLIWMAIHTIIIWLLSDQIIRMFFSKKGKELDRVRLIGNIVSTSIFAFLSTIPRLEGNIANAELFMMMPISLFLYMLLKNENNKKYLYYGAGLVAGIGLLFKVPVLFDFIGIIIWYFLFTKKKFLDSLKEVFRLNILIVVLGFITPILLTVINYYFKGIIGDYLRGALLINFGYVSSWSTSSYSFNPFASGLFVRGLMVAGLTLLLYIFRKNINKGLLLVSMWYFFSVFGSLLSSRPYPHYLLQPIVPLSLVIGLGIQLINKIWNKVMLVLVFLISLVVWIQFDFWYYPTLSYYQNFYKIVTKQQSYSDYINYFSSAKRNFPIADYLDERISEDDSFYVWGSDSALYNLLGKLPAGGKYIVNFHVKDFRAYDEVMENLNKNQPKYIVVLEDPTDFKDLLALLKTSYVPVANIEGSVVYLKL